MMGQCGCQDGEEGHTFLKIPNYNKMLFIQRWYHCYECPNCDGFDIQLISQEDFRDMEEFGCKIEGTIKELDYHKDKKQAKDVKCCYITIKDFFPQLGWLFKDFVEDSYGDNFINFTEKQIEQLDKINWKKFAKEFEKFVTKHCPNKRIS